MLEYHEQVAKTKGAMSHFFEVQHHYFQIQGNPN